MAVTVRLTAYGTLLRLALRNTLRQRRRSGLAILAIAFGVIAMILSEGFIAWIFWSNREQVTLPQLGHIQITRPGYQENAGADPHTYLMRGRLPVLQEMSRWSEVRNVTPRVHLNGLISRGESTLGFMGLGIDPEKDPYRHTLLINTGKGLSADDDTGVLLGEGLARALDASVGAKFVLLTNTPAGGLNAIEAEVRGIASTGVKAYDDNMLWLPSALAQKLLRIEGAHVWLVSLHDTAQTDAVLKKLRGLNDMAGYEITPWYELAEFYNKTVQLLQHQIDLVRLIIAVLILSGITNTMTMSVMERTVEIGTAMALGARRRRILALFASEGLLLGVVGGLAGIAIGVTLATVISYIGIPMPPAPGMSRGYDAAIIVSSTLAFQALLLAVVSTGLASLYPAWRASRMVIVDALRHNR